MKYKVTLKDKVYEVEVEKGEAMLIDEYEAKAPAAPAAAAVNTVAAAPAQVTAATPAASAPADAVKAPMPGNILKVLVSEGQKVNEGDPVIVIEAMKMENEVVANKSGSIGKIFVTKGQSVETGTALISIV